MSQKVLQMRYRQRVPCAVVQGSCVLTVFDGWSELRADPICMVDREHDARIVKEVLKAGREAKVPGAASIIATWLETGACTRKNMDYFYGCMQVSHPHAMMVVYKAVALTSTSCFSVAGTLPCGGLISPVSQTASLPSTTTNAWRVSALFSKIW